jgi:hypothetical protein
VTEPADPFWKLRPVPPTPPEDLCSCTGLGAVVVQPHLTANPIVCLTCRGEVLPERIGIDGALAEKIAAWQSFHDAFYTLWLDSGEFECVFHAMVNRVSTGS